MSPAAQEGLQRVLPVFACMNRRSVCPYLRAQVARAEDVMYLSWYEKGFKFRWDICSSVWDVEIANAQY